MGKQLSGDRPISLLATAKWISEPHRLAMTKGIHALCRERGWILYQYDSRIMRQTIEQWRPDAVIFVLDEECNDFPAQVLRGRTVVSAGHDHTPRGWPSVVPDDEQTGALAAQHLIDRGFRSLAVFGSWKDDAGKITHDWALRRIKGFETAANRANIPVSRFGEGIDPATGLPELNRFIPEWIVRWLKTFSMPTGVLALCDHWGQILSMACREADVRIPQDIALIGVDDMPALCEVCDPPLSSVAIPWERIGWVSAELAGNLIAGGEQPRRIVVPSSSVTVRQSSDTLAVDDPDVAAAMAIILAHADRPLSVTQILRQVPMALRRLQRRFKKHVGRCMVDEIRRVHIQQAKRLLAESDLPMSAIAQRSGFSSSPALSVAFRQETGTTPSKFRRRHQVNP